MGGKSPARLVLGFWAAWYALVVAGNVCDALRVAAVLPAGWRFASGNYDLVAKTTAIYGFPAWANAVLFAGVIVWEAAAGLAMGWAATRPYDSEPARAAIRRALLVSLGLWSAMILADELFVAFVTDIESTHMAIFTAHLVTWIAVSLRPG